MLPIKTMKSNDSPFEPRPNCQYTAVMSITQINNLSMISFGMTVVHVIDTEKNIQNNQK
jgi:hypothetical protein